jgi:membrane protease YdiL (CAAX protease family)
VGLFAGLPVFVVWAFLGKEAWDTATGAIFLLVPAILIQAGAEEVLFRGILMPSMIARYGVGSGVVLSACLFGFWHVYAGQGFADFAYSSVSTFVFGITSGVVALRQGHLGGVIALHLVWNVVSGLGAGFADWPLSFWQSYVTHYYSSWTLEDFLDKNTLNMALLPLMIETLLVVIICKSTIYEILARRSLRINTQTGQSDIASPSR